MVSAPRALAAPAPDPLSEPETRQALELAWRVQLMAAARTSAPPAPSPTPNRGAAAQRPSVRASSAAGALRGDLLAPPSLATGSAVPEVNMPQAVALLLSALESLDDDAEVESALTLGRGLERLAEAGALSTADLEGALPRITHPSARVALLRVRGLLTEEGAEQLCERIARTDADLEVRTEALVLLSARAEARTTAGLVEELLSRDPRLTSSLVRVLPRLPALRQALDQTLRTAARPEARRAAALALYAAGGVSQRQIETLAAESGGASVAATEALARALPASEEPLRRVLRRGLEPSARLSALAALFRASRLSQAELESLQTTDPLLGPEVTRLHAAAQATEDEHDPPAEGSPPTLANTTDEEELR